MKTPTIQTVQVLCLIGFLRRTFAGTKGAASAAGASTSSNGEGLPDRQVSCLKKIPLDMFKNSVDDQYINCYHKKEFKVQKPGYIPIPMKYMSIWNAARQYWAKLGPSVSKIKPIYGTAVVAYTMGGGLYRNFNNAVRDAGKSKYSYNHFAFKDYFFLLTRFVQARKIVGKCYEVFRGVNGIRFKIHSKQLVRFGQFASSSLVKEKAQNFGQDTFFSIRTCHGVPIYDLSYYPGRMGSSHPAVRDVHCDPPPEDPKGGHHQIEVPRRRSLNSCVRPMRGLSFRGGSPSSYPEPPWVSGKLLTAWRESSCEIPATYL
ncbi:NADP -arginine ADP-ribosyltransferase 2-like [Crotalus adamanteus]|uniref:NAD(P)(+)--arginine ADP-ribosyltransferase n=1 Tax=Crotalus adamanteus TaxID=8729 RepID=A0AAW1B1Z6_CROAD